MPTAVGLYEFTTLHCQLPLLIPSSPSQHQVLSSFGKPPDWFSTAPVSKSQGLLSVCAWRYTATRKPRESDDDDKKMISKMALH